MSEDNQDMPIQQTPNIWTEIENELCGRVARSREIMRALAMAGITPDFGTVAGLRMAADQLQDLLLNCN